MLNLRRRVASFSLLAIICSTSWIACRTADTSSALRDETTQTEPTPTDPVPPPAPTPSTAEQVKMALEASCGNCHGPASAGEGAINYINDLQKLIDKKKIKRGTEADRAKSRILVRILDEENPMPPFKDANNQDVPRMPPEAIELVKQWIMSDSPL